MDKSVTSEKSGEGRERMLSHHIQHVPPNYSFIHNILLSTSVVVLCGQSPFT